MLKDGCRILWRSVVEKACPCRNGPGPGGKGGACEKMPGPGNCMPSGKIAL